MAEQIEAESNRDAKADRQQAWFDYADSMRRTKALCDDDIKYQNARADFMAGYKTGRKAAQRKGG